MKSQHLESKRIIQKGTLICAVCLCVFKSVSIVAVSVAVKDTLDELFKRPGKPRVLVGNFCRTSFAACFLDCCCTRAQTIRLIQSNIEKNFPALSSSSATESTPLVSNKKDSGKEKDSDQTAAEPQEKHHHHHHHEEDKQKEAVETEHNHKHEKVNGVRI